MSPSKKDLFLASGSPRRLEMVAGLGLELEWRGLDVDESVLVGEAPRDYVSRVTRLKEEAGVAVARSSGSLFRCVLAADTAVVLDDEVLGKPRDDEDALAMLTSLAGRGHQVMSSYCIRSLSDEKMVQRTIVTEVYFRAAERDELQRYVATGEGRDKAGSYAIQGIGSFLVKGIAGSYSNVVGLPFCELIVDLKQLGILREYPQSV